MNFFNKMSGFPEFIPDHFVILFQRESKEALVQFIL